VSDVTVPELRQAEATPSRRNAWPLWPPAFDPRSATTFPEEIAQELSLARRTPRPTSVSVADQLRAAQAAGTFLRLAWVSERQAETWATRDDDATRQLRSAAQTLIQSARADVEWLGRLLDEHRDDIERAISRGLATISLSQQAKVRIADAVQRRGGFSSVARAGLAAVGAQADGEPPIVTAMARWKCWALAAAAGAAAGSGEVAFAVYILAEMADGACFD
jgi:hypothetical protein